MYRPLQKGDIMELFAPGKKLPKNVNLQKLEISTSQNLEVLKGVKPHCKSGEKQVQRGAKQAQIHEKGVILGRLVGNA